MARSPYNSTLYLPKQPEKFPWEEKQKFPWE